MTGVAEVTDEKRLKRFLHYGSVHGIYFPGSRLHGSHYTEENVESIRTVLKALEKEHVFEIIRKVYKENTSPHREMIPFILAECARIESLKNDAFKTAEILCDDTKLFLLFFKFGFERTPKIGTGPTFKRLISTYYLKKDVMKLAEEVGQYPNYRGWRHSDILRLGHIKAKPEDLARQAVLAYISRGTETMNNNFGDKPETKEIVTYLNKVDNFRKEKDPARVAETIETYMLTIDHVNLIHLKDKKVWYALLRQIPLNTLLNYFNYIARNKLFRCDRVWDEDFKSSLCDSLQNSQAIKDSGLHPSRVYLESMAYQHEAKFKLETAVKKNLRTQQKIPAVSPEIILGLTQLMKATFKLLKPTGLKYLIAVDPFDMNTRKCGHIPYLLPSQAAAIIVHSYLKVEPNVVLVGPTFEGPIQTIDVSKDSKIKDLEEILSNIRSKIIVPPKAMPKRDPTQSMLDVFEWTYKQKKKFDCFILIATAINSTNFGTKMIHYQKAMKHPKSKLVLISLCNAHHSIDCKEVFAVSGFDENVCSLVTSFVQEVF